jgi:hypothetical protein
VGSLKVKGRVVRNPVDRAELGAAQLWTGSRPCTSVRNQPHMISLLSGFDIVVKEVGTMYRYGPHFGIGTILVILFIVWLLFFHH